MYVWIIKEYGNCGAEGRRAGSRGREEEEQGEGGEGAGGERSGSRGREEGEQGERSGEHGNIIHVPGSGLV